jgi:hypothetical protein
MRHFTHHYWQFLHPFVTMQPTDGIEETNRQNEMVALKHIKVDLDALCKHDQKFFCIYIAHELKQFKIRIRAMRERLRNRELNDRR